MRSRISKKCGTLRTKPEKGKSGKPADTENDWRQVKLDKVRGLIKRADPDATEEIKWRRPANPQGVIVWSHGGILCTGEAHKNHVRLTFFSGASLDDPSHLFNSGLDSNTRRAITILEGDMIDEAAFIELVQKAVALNVESKH